MTAHRPGCRARATGDRRNRVFAYDRLLGDSGGRNGAFLNQRRRVDVQQERHRSARSGPGYRGSNPCLPAKTRSGDPQQLISPNASRVLEQQFTSLGTSRLRRWAAGGVTKPLTTESYRSIALVYLISLPIRQFGFVAQPVEPRRDRTILPVAHQCDMNQSVRSGDLTTSVRRRIAKWPQASGVPHRRRTVAWPRRRLVARGLSRRRRARYLRDFHP